MNHKIFIFIFVVNYYVKAIPCSFQFKGKESFISLQRLEQGVSSKRSSLRRDEYDFNCEDGYTTTESTTKKYKSSNEDSQETNEYLEIESGCETRTRTIIPKALNNIYNKLTKVLNNDTFVQSIKIEECVNTKETCNSGVATPYSEKYICRQKFVRITLKALNEINLIVDEQFFYPSHCICELVFVKRVKRKFKKQPFLELE